MPSKQVEKEPISVEPFLTLRVLSGDAGTSATCPELDISMNMGGENKQSAAVKGLLAITTPFAQTLVSRVSNGTFEDASLEKITIARRIIEAHDKGIHTAQFYKPEYPDIEIEQQLQSLAQSTQS